MLVNFQKWSTLEANTMEISKMEGIVQQIRILYILWLVKQHKELSHNLNKPTIMARSASICRSKQIPDSRQIADFFLTAILSDIRC